MKKLLLTILLLISIGATAQEYPHITEQDGKKVVIITIEQARKIDKDLDILKQLISVNNDCDKVMDVYISIVDSQKNQILLYETNIIELEGLLNIKDNQISNLQTQINNHLEKDKLYDSDIKIKEQQIKILNKKLKWEKLKFWTILPATIILTILLAK